MIAVRDHSDQLGSTLPIVVTFADGTTRLDAYRDHLGIDFPLLANSDRSLYDAVGAGRGTLRQIWSPGTIAMYARLLRRGRRLRPPHEDTRQLGADLLIDETGRLRHIWLPQGPDLRPTISELTDAVIRIRPS